MTLILIIAAIPLGWYVQRQVIGYLVYTAAQSFLFAFQTGKLVIEWVGGNKNAFGPYPKASSGETWSYLVVNLVIYAVGLGVLAGTYRLRARRLAKVTSGTSRVMASSVR
jgi:hypothetical protein